MSNSSRRIPSLIVAVLIAIALWASVVASGRAALAHAALQSSVLPTSAATEDGRSTTARPETAAPVDYRHVMIELAADPAVMLYAAHRNQVEAAAPDSAATVRAVQAQLAVIETEQAHLLERSAPLEIQPLYQLQRVYNGIAARVPANNLAALVALDGVKAVHPLHPKRPDNAVSVPYIGTPTLWADTAHAVGGLTGKGMTIAVIDTGVDYLHATFGGSAAYDRNDPTVIGDVPDFPGPKVIGGYDFAGDAYDADPESDTYNPIPRPDPDPVDCYDHGTHVAGTAAGYGVVATGAGGGIYTGPYDESTYATDFAVGPGVAPEAQIIALKVFGCQGSSDLTELAIEWAVDPDGDGDFSDRVDVINLSLGSPYGSIYEPSAVAANNAALIGIVVVASAGNSGDTYFVTGTPAVADRVISVAAASDHLAARPAALMADSGLLPAVSISSFSSRGPRRHDWALKPDIAAPGQGIISALGGLDGQQSIRLSGTSMAAPHIAGAMALLRQAHPTWRIEELKALLMNTARTQTGAAVTLSPTRTGAGLVDLPATQSAPAVVAEASGSGRVALSFAPAEVLDRYSEVEAVRIVNKVGEPISYTVGYVSIVDGPGIEIAPARSTVTVAARGVATLSIDMVADGTALRHARDPNVPDTQTFPRHWISEESGQLLFWPGDGTLVAVLDQSNATTSSSEQRAGTAALRLDPATGEITATTTMDGATLLPTDAMGIYHGSAATGDGALVATLEVASGPDRAALSGTASLTGNELFMLAQGELYLQIRRTGTQILELRGQINAMGPVLHLPLYASARPLADLRVETDALTFVYGESHTQPLTLTGIARAGASPPTDLVSLVAVLELTHADGNELPYPTPDGQADIFDHADLKYIGIISDFGIDPNGPIAERTLYFGLSTYGEWTSPNEVEFSLFVDTNEDGIDDYRLYNADVRGYATDSNETSDAFITVVEDLQNGTYSQLQFLNMLSSLAYDTRPYSTNVMLLPVKAADLGLGADNPEFNYRVESKSNEAKEPIDSTPVLSYNLKHPAFDLFRTNLDAPLMQAHPDEPIDVRILPANFERRGRPDLLLLHFHNGPAVRDETVDVRLTWPEALYLPYLIRR